MRWQLLLATCVTPLLIGAAVFVVDARRTAARMRAQGRLSQLHLALLNYQTVNGFLPDRNVTDPNGRPLFSWVGSILPYIEQHEIASSLDISQPWNSPSNEKSLVSGERFWNWYTEDGYFISTFNGAGSMWDADGNPLGKLADYPSHVVLVATAVDGVHPLEPFSLSEARLREILAAGHKAVYVDADRTHGTVKLDGESIVFARGTVQ
ncbi:DUF1559 family PulG-like putative transporter [Stieleria mannarensis]|uniref:DUF1559 family PulG-like putative transporter n=1 Tax=Stieleria mannarensis TaxID=2755585 RepID=UPI0016012B15|nr:DUF1559 domain-containing protein [Rhodopirellula sp. JC639]